MQANIQPIKSLFGVATIFVVDSFYVTPNVTISARVSFKDESGNELSAKNDSLSTDEYQAWGSGDDIYLLNTFASHFPEVVILPDV